VKCTDFPCQDVNKKRYTVPSAKVDPGKTKTLMISEAPPEDSDDYFYALDNPFYLQTTVQAFSDAGFKVTSMKDVLNLGVYVTTAMKCAKTSYSIFPQTIDNCSIRVLENEINLFPKTKAILLMGDTAIKAMNYIAKRNTGKPLIPSGSTYKIREGEYFYKKVSLSLIFADRQELPHRKIEKKNDRRRHQSRTGIFLGRSRATHPFFAEQNLSVRYAEVNHKCALAG
jgi:hypothetical protein